jgi:hypothetical protein
MIRTGIVAALLASTPAAAEEIACRADGVPADAIEMREAILRFDPSTLGGADASYAAFLIPADWREEGSAVFDYADPCGAMEKPRWRAASPDGEASVEFLAGEGWTASAHKAQFSNCAARDIYNARGYADALARSVAPDATFGELRDRGDIVEPFRKQLQAYDQYGARTEASAAEIDFERLGEGGGAEYGLIVAAVMTFTPAPTIPEFETRATAMPPLIARSKGVAPNAALVEAIRASALVDPNWLRYRERLTAPPGRMPTPGDRLPIRQQQEPFPEREAGEGAKVCGRTFSALTVPSIWRRDDGRYWFAPALKPPLAAAE